jgi:hypothetical protein
MSSIRWLVGDDLRAETKRPLIRSQAFLFTQLGLMPCGDFELQKHCSHFFVLGLQDGSFTSFQ